MSRPPSIIPSSRINLAIPEDLRMKLDILLFSEVEGRVPKGAYQEFFSTRIREFFGWRRLSLEPFGYPQGFFITGPKEMLEYIEQSLKEKVLP
jgi:hypothetical protein